VKLSELKPPKLMVKRTSVPAMLDSVQLFERLERNGWLRPAVESGKETGCDLFLVSEIEGAVNRLMRERLPA
jgi:hypothetical protein